ncbi:hypothetical protein SAY87_004692 [Trapa incisa]|uniref:THO complex subunit 2 n=1 Tax=Trapa incisa TaxID=236973 RepID=A0AAN7JPR6_9MYRT|nr:hypothetical protein SAY87_004692 [Trapa incisa]
MSLPPVECIYVTDEFVREWKSHSANPTRKPPDPVPLLRFLYELCWNMVRGELPLQKCKPILEAVEFSDKPTSEELGSAFSDIVSQMALDLTLQGELRVRLIKLVYYCQSSVKSIIYMYIHHFLQAKWLVESTLVPLRLFQERCEEEFLWDAELIKIKPQELKNKEVRVNTRLLYQQTKFNLLREESEGYAKLVTLLCRGSEASTPAATATTVGFIKSLIGHFDLDPNRVFDIVLECFELQPVNNIFLELIPIFPKSHASQILGFKFQYYQRMEVNSPVPFGLYMVTALLVKEKFIDLNSVYSHLLPKDDEAFEHYSAFSAKRLDEANKIGKINLAAIGRDLMEDEKQGDVSTDLFAALDMERDAVIERLPELENNQSLGLLSGFLSVEDWYHANILFERLSSLNPVAHLQICEGLFRLIEKKISSAYNAVRQMRLHGTDFTHVSGGDAMDTTRSSLYGSFIDLPKELFQMLACAGPYLYRDTILLQKVCRVLKLYLFSAVEYAAGGNGVKIEFVNGEDKAPRIHLKEARLRAEEALGTCLLPSLQLVPANPAVGQEIWEVMSLLSYEVRYRLYGEWEKEDERIPMLLAARQTAKLDTRRILKRLAKENLKQLGRMVAKLAHANPMTVLRTIVHQIEAYRDMIAPVVDAFKYLTQLEYDILEYVVIERLAQGGREKLKDDGLNLSDWLQSLASFWGHLCKKYPSMELRGLFQYLVNQLKRGQGIELVVVQELVTQMANVQYTENLTEEQLDAMAGSETLRHQATSFGLTRNNKALIKSTNRLRDSLLPKDDPKLAIPLLLLIAQHRSLVVINAEAPYVKMVSEQFDRCHGTLLQYVEFLCSSVAPATAFAQLIPSLDDLVHLYHLEPEVAFLIYRPAMRIFNCQGSPKVCWPLDIKESVHSDTESEDTSHELVLDLGSPENPIKWSDLLATVKTMLPAKAWNSLSPDLYATFWGLTLYDLYVPRARYESEIAKQRASLKVLEELSDTSSSAITKRKKDKEKVQESLDRLTSELHKHEENVASVRARLYREKDKWLSSCPDTLKINMEFLQRCIFPRCTFSMPDAVYCAMFVNTLHTLGTPFFNTVNHIDVLICKTLQPMICCCTEYEVGRLGRFLYETLKTAYYWKSDESIYERECGNMPGFAVYYRYPNSQRVTYSQFIKVHWKWSQRITKLLIACLESTEYMEIRNALIMLTKISGVFPVTRKTGINLEKRVTKIKGDEREDLKVLATGVAAALAARKPHWVTDEEFGMGYLDLKPSSIASKSLTPNATNGPAVAVSQNDSGRVAQPVANSGTSVKEQTSRTKFSDSKHEKPDTLPPKSESNKARGGSLVNGSDAQISTASAIQAGGLNQRHADDFISKDTSEPEVKSSSRRSVPSASVGKPMKQDSIKDDSRSGKAASRTSAAAQSLDSRQTGVINVSSASAVNGGTSKGSTISTRASLDAQNVEPKAESTSKSSDGKAPGAKDNGTDNADVLRVTGPRQDLSLSALKLSEKLQKRSSPADEADKVNKRRKGDSDSRDMEGEIRISDRERSMDVRTSDVDRLGNDEQSMHRTSDRMKDKSVDRHDKDYRERTERDSLAEKSRDKSMERYGRERSVERGKGRDEMKDEKSKLRHGESVADKSYGDDRFHGQGLPPPPPLPPNIVPQSVPSRRDSEDSDRRFVTTRLTQRLSPRHEERERRRSEENVVLQDDAKRRREDDFRDRKREEREVQTIKVDERDRERERDKASMLKDEMEATSAAKRRKLKREHVSTAEPGEYSPGGPPPPLTISLSQPYDARGDRDRKGAMASRPIYLEEPAQRIHSKDMPAKVVRRDADSMYERDWEEEKRQRVEPKRRHRK